MSDSTGHAPPTAIAAGSSAAAQAAAFADDPHVHFDRQAGAWRFEDDDGNELEYDAAKGAWVSLVRPAHFIIARILSLTVLPLAVRRLAKSAASRVLGRGCR